MKLATLATSKGKVSIQSLGGDKALAREVQGRLIALGCLDPPADGAFGPISTAALAGFAKRAGVAFRDQLTGQLADALLQAKPDSFIKLTLGNDFASRIVKYMQLKKYYVARLPGYQTIVYVEGCDADGKPNTDAFDGWNDRRMVLTIEANGRPMIRHNVTATSEPGKFFTMHPINKMGTARIALEQFKAWRVGMHHPSMKPPSKHVALVQAGKIKVFRDKNKDGIRTGDPLSIASGMGINQHSGHDQNIKSIGKASAGCLVGRNDAEHRMFMDLVKLDPRFKASNGYTFMTAVIGGDDLAKRFPVA